MKNFASGNEFADCVKDPSNVIKAVYMFKETIAQVRFQKEEDFVGEMGNTNAVIAAYTTAHARLKLYSYIEKLQDRTLYFDTVSEGLFSFCLLFLYCFCFRTQ